MIACVCMKCGAPIEEGHIEYDEHGKCICKKCKGKRHVFTDDEILAAVERLKNFGALDGVYVVVGNSLQNWDVNGDDVLEMLRQGVEKSRKADKLKVVAQRALAVISKVVMLEEFASLLKSGAADALIASKGELEDALKEESV